MRIIEIRNMNCQLCRDRAAAIHAVSLSRVQAAHAHLPVLAILNMFVQIMYWNWINIISWDTIFYLKSLKAGFKLLMRNCKSYPVSICLHRLCNWVILTFLLPTFTTSYIFFKFPFYKICPLINLRTTLFVTPGHILGHARHTANSKGKQWGLSPQTSKKLDWEVYFIHINSQSFE